MVYLSEPKDQDALAEECPVGSYNKFQLFLLAKCNTHQTFEISF